MSKTSLPSKVEIVVGDRGHLVSCLCIGESLPEYFDKAGLKEMRHSLSSDDLYVALEDERAVGFVTIISDKNEKAEITWLAVTPERRRKGIGSTLLRWSEEDLAEKGVKLLTVKTLAEEADYPPFDATRRFYERNGFLHVETVDPYPGWNGDPAAIYTKNLLTNEARCDQKK